MVVYSDVFSRKSLRWDILPQCRNYQYGVDREKTLPLPGSVLWGLLFEGIPWALLGPKNARATPQRVSILL